MQLKNMTFEDIKEDANKITINSNTFVQNGFFK